MARLCETITVKHEFKHTLSSGLDQIALMILVLSHYLLTGHGWPFLWLFLSLWLLKTVATKAIEKRAAIAAKADEPPQSAHDCPKHSSQD